MTALTSHSENRPRQVAVIAARRHQDELHLCLIRKNDSSKWAIPKGFIDRGDTAEQAALTEAQEEAGILGKIIGFAGHYCYSKGPVPLTVAVYSMEVIEEQSHWREMNFRKRAWVPGAEAFRLLSKHPVFPVLGSAVTMLKEGFSGGSGLSRDHRSI